MTEISRPDNSGSKGEQHAGRTDASGHIVMIDPTLRAKAEQAAWAAAARAKQENLDEWVERLQAAGQSPRLEERIQQVRDQRWAGALPTWEPTGLAISSSSSPLPVIGIDGSQIYPPERSPMLWAYIQAVVYRTGCKPVLASKFLDFEQELAQIQSGVER